MPDLEKESFGTKVKTFAKSLGTTPPALLKEYFFGPDPRVFDFSPETTNVTLKPHILLPDGTIKTEPGTFKKIKIGAMLSNRIAILETLISKDWQLTAVLKDNNSFHLVWAYKGKEKVRSARKKRSRIIFNKGKKQDSNEFLRKSTDEKLPPIIERSTDNYAIISDEYFNRTFLRGTNLYSNNVTTEPVDKQNGLALTKDIKTKPSNWQQGGVWSISFSVESISRGIRRLQRELDGYTRQNGERVKGFYEELAHAKAFWPDRSPAYSKEVQDVLQKGIKAREERIAYLGSLRVENPIYLFTEQESGEPKKDQEILQPAAAS